MEGVGGARHMRTLVFVFVPAGHQRSAPRHMATARAYK